ncbi:MAG: PD-(D/E)XK nuclease family protein [Bacilli bacterium]|nr:PD-(D/E)XK nuclease family protein [Bacilli bacterium]
MLDKIKDNSILIVPSNLKSIILKKINTFDKLFDIKILSREEFIERMTYSYDNDALLFLMDKYKYDPNICKIYLDNMKYVDNCNYSSSRLNDLYKLKEELLELGLLKIDKFFNKYLKNKNIYVYGYIYIDNLFKKYLDLYKYEIIEKDKYDSNKMITVYEASTLEEEVDFVFNKIGDLLNSGIDINKIKIVNYSDKYMNVFNKLSIFYNIPIEDKGFSIYSTEIVRDYLERLKSCRDFYEAINYIKDKYNKEENVLRIISTLVSITNKYIVYDYSFESIYSLIKNDLKNSKLSINDLVNKVEFGNLNSFIYDKDNYVFLIGFNQNELPKLYKDEDYISDEDKEFVNLESTSLKNKLEKERVLDFIYSTSNLVISYPLKHLSNNYYPSNLINENGFKVEDICLSSNSYSINYNKIKLTKYLDDFVKYGTVNNNLSLYYNNYSINYLSYDNKFTGISKEQLYSKLNNKLLLSYSSINTYNKCNFRYYLDNILKINKYEETFSIKVGNLFHDLLSKCFNDDFDLDKEWDLYLTKLELSFRDKVLLIKLKEELVLIIKFVKNLHKETYLTNSLMEHKIYIDKSRDIDISFMGIIDKCMYREKDGDTLVAIVDYKTGNPDINLGNVSYGIDMQLPIYWYLVKKGSLFSNSKFVGFYLEKILHSELKRDKSRDYEACKLDNLKLVGYSTNNKERLEKFDITYENSEFIKSMKVKNDGEFYHYTKVLDDQVLDMLIEYIDKVIEDDITSILDCNFSINPKQVGMENIGCKYCKYKDICFMKNEDIVKLKEYDDLSFLGGDISA